MVDFNTKKSDFVDQLQNWGTKLDKKLNSVVGKIDKKLIEFSKGAKDIASAAFHPAKTIKKTIQRERNDRENKLYNEVRKEKELKGKSIFIKTSKTDAKIFENNRMRVGDVLVYAKSDNSFLIKMKIIKQEKEEFIEIKADRGSLTHILKELVSPES